MSVRSTDSTHVCLFDDTSMLAFGPVFDSELDVDEFLEWHQAQYEAGRRFNFGTEEIIFVDDVRKYRPNELEHIVRMWDEEPLDDDN